MVKIYDQLAVRASCALNRAGNIKGILSKFSFAQGMKHVQFYTSLVAFVFLAACNSAGAHFRGLPATTVTVDGSTFDVRVRGDLAEAIRTNREYAPRFGPIRERAGRAMALVSGCEVKEVRGDQAQATGILRCKNGRKPTRSTIPPDLVCTPVWGTELKQLGGRSVEIACEPA